KGACCCRARDPRNASPHCCRRGGEFGPRACRCDPLTCLNAPDHSATRRAVLQPEKDDASMGFLTQLFTWWNGQTLNLRFFTWRNGEFVGADEAGNRYYRAPSQTPGSIPEPRCAVPA